MWDVTTNQPVNDPWVNMSYRPESIINVVYLILITAYLPLVEVSGEGEGLPCKCLGGYIPV